MRMVRSMSRDVRRNRDELLWWIWIDETGGINGVLAVQREGIKDGIERKYLDIMLNI